MEAGYLIRPSFPLRLYLGVFALTWVGVLVYSHLGSDGAQPFWTIVMLATGVAYTGRVASTKVEVRPEGLVVRNVWRTALFSWHEIEGFRVQRALGSMFTFGRSVTALTINGEAVTMDATIRFSALTGGFDDVTEMSRRLGNALRSARQSRDGDP